MSITKLVSKTLYNIQNTLLYVNIVYKHPFKHYGSTSIDNK